MNENRQSETVPGPSASSVDSPLVQAAAVACAYLKVARQGRANKAYEVLSELAQQTLKRASCGQDAEFTALNLQAGVAPGAAKEPSGWLSPLWSRLTAEEHQWTEGLHDTARHLGLGFSPKLAKKPGSPALYSLEPVALPPQQLEAPEVPVAQGGIRYTPVAVAAPGAWMGSALRNGILRWTAGARIAIAGSIIVGTSLVLAIAWLTFTVGLKTTRPLTLSDLLSVGAVVGFVWQTVRIYRFLDRLFELRIVLAPNVLTPIAQDNVTLELRRATADDQVGELAFVRYTSTCPLCEGLVVIDSGRAAFPDRLVGRCRRAAREHVFSFDPVSRLGLPLNR